MRALGSRVEAPDTLDLITEEIDAIGLVRIVGVEVNQTATSRDLSRLFAEGFGIVIEIACEGGDQFGKGI